jgi:acid phosphatase type 7
MDYVFISDVDLDWNMGSGSYSSTLTTTARNPQCQFRMFANNGYTLLGESMVMNVYGYGGPSQLHIALTGIEDEMRVHWTSVDEHLGSVSYGLVGEDTTTYLIPEASLPHTYQASDMCESPATNEEGFVVPGWLHEVVMTNLKPNKFYWYQVQDASGLTSDVFTFQAPPAKGPSQEPFSYIVYGDMGVTGGMSATETASLASVEVNKYGARMTHHIGDISYARGNSATWEAWFPLVQPYAATAPCGF